MRKGIPEVYVLVGTGDISSIACDPRAIVLSVMHLFVCVAKNLHCVIHFSSNISLYFGI